MKKGAMAKSNRKLLVAGLLAFSGSSLTAWAVATHPEGAEPAPMEALPGGVWEPGSGRCRRR